MSVSQSDVACPLLVVENISHRFGDFVALDDISFAVPRRGVHSFIGPNGAGKTTLFNCVAGLLRPSRGKVSLDGVDITRVPAHRRVHLGLGRSFQVTSLFQNLTVFENARLAAQAHCGRRAFGMLGEKGSLVDASDKAGAALALLGLMAMEGALAGELSHGQQRRLEIALAVCGDAKALLLDEPTSGMGVDDLAGMTALIAELARDRAVILVEHNIDLVLAISETLTVLHHGRVLCAGAPRAVAARPEVREAYLGSAVPC